MTTNKAEVWDILTARGYRLLDWWEGVATEFSAKTPDGEVKFAYGFNVDGWEACIERVPGDQDGLEDGPGPDADADEVVAWVIRLVANPLEYLA